MNIQNNSNATRVNLNQSKKTANLNFTGSKLTIAKKLKRNCFSFKNSFNGVKNFLKSFFRSKSTGKVQASERKFTINRTITYNGQVVHKYEELPPVCRVSQERFKSLQGLDGRIFRETRKQVPIAINYRGAITDASQIALKRSIEGSNLDAMTSLRLTNDVADSKLVRQTGGFMGHNCSTVSQMRDYIGRQRHVNQLGESSSRPVESYLMHRSESSKSLAESLPRSASNNSLNNTTESLHSLPSSQSLRRSSMDSQSLASDSSSSRALSSRHSDALTHSYSSSSIASDISSASSVSSGSS